MEFCIKLHMHLNSDTFDELLLQLEVGCSEAVNELRNVHRKHGPLCNGALAVITIRNKDQDEPGAMTVECGKGSIT